MLAMLIMVMMVKVISMRKELTISNDPKEDNQGTEWLNRTTENTGRVVRRRPAWLSSTTSMATVRRGTLCGLAKSVRQTAQGWSNFLCKF